jgi:hypothetical protein
MACRTLDPADSPGGGSRIARSLVRRLQLYQAYNTTQLVAPTENTHHIFLYVPHIKFKLISISVGTQHITWVKKANKSEYDNKHKESTDVVNRGYRCP